MKTLQKALFSSPQSSFFIVSSFLSILGIALLFFSSFFISMKYTGQPYHFVSRQFLALLISLMVMLFFSFFNRRKLYQSCEILFLAIVGILFLVFLPGVSEITHGARRWINLPGLPFSLQPSEIIKPFLLIVFAELIARKKQRKTSPGKEVFPLMLILVFCSALIAIEPDVSSAILIFTTGIILFMLSGMSIKYMAGLSLLLLPLGLWFVNTKEYLGQRILFLQAEQDPLGTGYHVLQSLAAIKKGGLFGTLFHNENSLSFYNFFRLPDAHNDFSFAVIVNLGGALGAITVLALYVFLLRECLRLLEITQSAQDRFFVLGATILLGMETMLHVMVNLGLAPPTGSSLPFISYKHGFILITSMVLQKPFGKTRKLHFIGIGGIGMSALAKILRSMGFEVTGSDIKSSSIIDELRKNFNISISIGHGAENVKTPLDVVITSSAISPANPEILEARDKGIPIISRGEMLAEIMRLKKGVAVAGTHGKTTTTSLLTAIFRKAGYSPTAIIGGKWFGIQSNAELGSSEIIICETDESDGSFLRISPIFSIVTNIDSDHIDFYKTEENLNQSFLSFINKTPFFGKAFLCASDQRIVALLDKVEKPFATYALAGTAFAYNNYGKQRANFEAEILERHRDYSRYMLIAARKPLGVVRISMTGDHNILNSLAAAALALEVGIGLGPIQEALSEFKGVDRRLSQLGSWHGFSILDDYGHHPTEIATTLAALRHHYAKIVVIFQPHRYSRTLLHYKGFARELLKADTVFIMPIYAANEPPIKNVSSSMISDEVHKLKKPKALRLELCKNVPELMRYLKTEKPACTTTNAKPSALSVILTIGAGDIYKTAKKLAGWKTL